MGSRASKKYDQAAYLKSLTQDEPPPLSELEEAQLFIAECLKEIDGKLASCEKRKNSRKMKDPMQLAWDTAFWTGSKSAMNMILEWIKEKEEE